MNKHPILGFATGGVFTLLALTSPNPPVKGLSALAALLSFGYTGGALASLQSAATARTRLERDLRDHYTQLLSESKSQLTQLQTQLNESQRDRERDKKTIRERYAAALEAHKQLLGTETQQTLKEALEREKTALERQKLQRIKARNSEHRRREQWLIGQIEAASEKLDQASQLHRDELTALVEKYEALLDEYQRVLDSYHPEIQEIQALFAQQMEDVTGERDRVYNALQQANQPRKFIGYGRIAELGNNLIDWLGERGILTDPIDCKGNTGGWATVTLRPRNATLEQIERLKSSLWLDFALLGEPKMKIEEGAITFSLHTDSATGKASSSTPQAPDEWFPNAVKSCQHIRVTGERDSGKSTLVSNLVDLKLIQNPDIEIRLCNPNYGSPKDDWKIPTEWKSYEEAIEGLQTASDLVLERNEKAREIKDAGLPRAQFKPVLFIFDELESIVSWHKDTAPVYLKNCLTKGTHYNVHIIYITQSPLCSRLKLNQTDLDHSAGFHLGKGIARVLDDNRMMEESGRNKLKAQYERMKRDDYKFICLYEHDSQRFLAPTPPPNFYQEVKEEQVDSPSSAPQPEPLTVGGYSDDGAEKEQLQKHLKTLEKSSGAKSLIQVFCPQCGSSNTKKDGKTAQKMQRYQCKDCQRRFQK